MPSITLDELQQEYARATRDGISRETLPSAREGQLDGYLAGLLWAINHADHQDDE